MPRGAPGGPEAEFYEAHQRWKEDNSRPVLMYFCEREQKPDLRGKSKEEVLDQMEQDAKVVEFRDKVVGANGMFWTFTELPDFKKKVTQHLDDAIWALVGGNDSPPPPPPDESALPHYLRRLRLDCLRMPLTALGEGVQDERSVTLDQVFIALHVAKHELRRGEDLEPARGEPETVPVIDALDEAPFAVLLGDPGSGKSSIVNYLVAEQTDRVLAGRDPLVPMRIVLRDLSPALAALALPAGSADRQKTLARAVVEQAVEAANALEAGDAAGALRHAFRDARVLAVFDGLDEVPGELRGLVREAVGAAIMAYNLPRAMVTCRIRSYAGDAVFATFPAFTLRPLEEAQITTFVEAWYEAQLGLNKLGRPEADRLKADLAGVAAREPLLALARNPMLLTTMTIIHQQEAELPRERVRLYDKAVELLLKRWQKGKGLVSTALAALIDSPEERMRPLMEQLAFKAHSAGAGDKAAELERQDAIDLLTVEAQLGDDELAIQFLNYVDTRAGLLIGRGGTPKRPATYAFPHRTFQEYLAGCHVMGRAGVVPTLQELSETGDAWAVAVEMGVEELFFNRRQKHTLLNYASLLTANVPDTPASHRQHLWAAKMLALVGPETVARERNDVEKGEVLLARVTERTVALLASPLPPIERAEAGRVLAALGDPRPEVMTIEGMRFCYVPAGPFSMGEEKHTIDVPYAYWIGQFPVTQAQFAAFTNEGGYETEKWWTPGGWKYIQEEGRRAPRPRGYPFDLPNHPAYRITWYEAQAFVTWLNDRALREGWIPAGGRLVLPNEPEWEKAARGGHAVPEPVLVPVALARLHSPSIDVRLRKNPHPGRRYPWGDVIDPGCCNYDETKIGSTSSPGCFSANPSPYGVQEMSGNVWEWSRTVYGKADYRKQVTKWIESEILTEDASRVLRGGSFKSSAFNARCADRSVNFPYFDDLFVGFRVVFAPP